MSEWIQDLTLTQNVDWGFLLSTTFSTSGVITKPITYKCLLKVLCPVRRPITTLDCVLLKDNNRALVARSGPQINSRACLCVLQGPHHNTRCWFSIQLFIFLLIFCLENPKKASGPTNRWTEPSLASLSAISFPRSPAWATGKWYSIPGRGTRFFASPQQTSSGANPTCLTNMYRGFFPQRWSGQGTKISNLHPVNNASNIPSFPPYCLIL